MTSQASVLAIIPARGGSKGIPNKNVKMLGGKPLIAWTVEAALTANCVTRTIVSTDDPAIAEVASKAGAEVPFVRPAELASDTASSADVVTHALTECPGYDYFVLLQPTSPLREAADIDAAFSEMLAASMDGCVSVSVAQDSPWLMYLDDGYGRLKPVLPPLAQGMRRQDFPETLILNGAIYFMKTEQFLRTAVFVTEQTSGFLLPHERAVDIDTYADFARAETWLARKNMPKSYGELTDLEQASEKRQ